MIMDDPLESINDIYPIWVRRRLYIQYKRRVHHYDRKQKGVLARLKRFFGCCFLPQNDEKDPRIHDSDLPYISDFILRDQGCLLQQTHVSGYPAEIDPYFELKAEVEDFLHIITEKVGKKLDRRPVFLYPSELRAGQQGVSPILNGLQVHRGAGDLEDATDPALKQPNTLPQATRAFGGSFVVSLKGGKYDLDEITVLR